MVDARRDPWAFGSVGAPLVVGFPSEGSAFAVLTVRVVPLSRGLAGHGTTCLTIPSQDSASLGFRPRTRRSSRHALASEDRWPFRAQGHEPAPDPGSPDRAGNVVVTQSAWDENTQPRRSRIESATPPPATNSLPGPPVITARSLAKGTPGRTCASSAPKPNQSTAS